MSWPDIILVAAVAGLLGSTTLLLVRRMRRANRELDQLRREVAVFSEASTRVADTLDRVLLGRTTPTETGHSSRRYLLSEAQRALSQGESLDAVAARFQLSHDESHLLRFSTAASSPDSSAGSSAGPSAGPSKSRSWAA